MTWTVSAVMTKNLVTVGPATPLNTCGDLVRINEISAVPVVEADLWVLRSDESIRREIKRDYFRDIPVIGSGHVVAAVEDDVAHLYGELDRGNQTGPLMRAVAGAPGMVGVKSHLKIGTASPADDAAGYA